MMPVMIPDVLHLCDRCGELAAGECGSCAEIERAAAAFVATLPPETLSLSNVRASGPGGRPYTFQEEACFAEAVLAAFDARCWRVRRRELEMQAAAAAAFWRAVRTLGTCVALWLAGAVICGGLAALVWQLGRALLHCALQVNP